MTAPTRWPAPARRRKAREVWLWRFNKNTEGCWAEYPHGDPSTVRWRRGCAPILFREVLPRPRKKGKR